MEKKFKKGNIKKKKKLTKKDGRRIEGKKEGD